MGTPIESMGHCVTHFKVLANKKDIPYQSLLKMLLIEKVGEEFRETR